MKLTKKILLIALLSIPTSVCFSQRTKDRNYFESVYQYDDRAKNNVALLYRDDAEIKEGIEKKYIDVNFRYRGGKTLLFNALIEYNYEPEKFLKVAGYLMKNGADPNIADDDGDTPLLYAVRNISRQKDIRNIEFLLRNNADVKAATNSGLTVLAELCGEKDADINLIKTFIKKGAPLEADENYSPLTSALHAKNIEIARLLIENGADINRKDGDSQYPLNLACELGDLKLVKFMLNKGADVNVSNDGGRTPLHYAVDSVSKDNLEIVKMLVERGADVNARTNTGYTPLIYAGWDRKNGFEIIRYLVGKNADVNAKTDKNYNVGMSSARLLNLECCRFLSDNGFDFKTCDDEGMTPMLNFIKAVTCTNSESLLYYSAIMENEDEIMRLVDFYADKSDINAATKFEMETALHIACSSLISYTKLIEALIKNGADVNARGAYNRTPIYSCLRHPEMVKVLIDSGADLSLKSKDGKTCLDVAEEMIKVNPDIISTVEILKSNSSQKKNYSFVQLCEYNYFDEASKMLAGGKVRNPDDYDQKGFTPLHYAVENKNIALAKMLLDKGCDINRRQKKDGTTVLYQAVKERNLEMISLLLKYAPDLSLKYRHPLYTDMTDSVLSLCIDGKEFYDTAKCLLDAGADPNFIIDANSGQSLTAYCCYSGDTKITELLIEYGGNPFATWNTYPYHSTYPVTNSIVSNGIEYQEKYAVYIGLEKFYADKTLVATENLRVRNYSSLSARTITTMKKGTKVKILEANEMEIIDDIHSCWVKIEILPGGIDTSNRSISSGTTGWCFLGYLETVK